MQMKWHDWVLYWLRNNIIKMMSNWMWVLYFLWRKSQNRLTSKSTRFVASVYSRSLAEAQQRNIWKDSIEQTETDWYLGTCNDGSRTIRTIENRVRLILPSCRQDDNHQSWIEQKVLNVLQYLKSGEPSSCCSEENVLYLLLQTQLSCVTSALAEKIDVPKFQTRILGNKHS